MKKKEVKLVRVHYMEDSEIKKHAEKSKEGISRWFRGASKDKYKKEARLINR